MEYSIELLIKVPLTQFSQVFWNPDLSYHWQDGLKSIEHISGEPKKEGSKMKLTYTLGQRNMEIIETVETSNFPSQFNARYYTKGMDSLQQNSFSETKEGYTKWVSKNNFYPLNISMRLFSVFMPGAFKKQSRKYMIALKAYLEDGKSVKNS